MDKTNKELSQKFEAYSIMGKERMYNMIKCTNMQQAVNRINTFINNSKRKNIEIFFKYGFYLKLSKIIDNNNRLFLDIHTAGFDGKLPFLEAIDWIKWTLLDYQGNEILD